MTTITIWSESGGVGKTTTALNLGAALGRDGHRVLLVDLDPQPASLTDHAGHPERKTDDGPTVVDAMLEEGVDLSTVLVEDEPFDLVPGHESLATLEATVRAEGISTAEFLLRAALDPLAESYDYVLVDPPATLNLLVDNALIASGNVLIPMEMTRKGERSVAGVLETVEALETQLRRAQPDFELGVLGVLPNKVSGSSLNREVRESLEREEVEVLPVTVPDYNVLEEAWDARLDVFRYADHDSYGLRPYQERLLDAYTELAETIVDDAKSDPNTGTQVVAE
jgi:chromosome partitioning protein